MFEIASLLLESLVLLVSELSGGVLTSGVVLESLSQAAQSKAAIHKATLLLCFLIDMVLFSLEILYKIYKKEPLRVPF